MHKTYSLGENTPQLAESVALKSTVVKCHSANHNHIYNNSILPLNLFTTPLKPGKNLWWQILFNPSLAPTLSSSCRTSQVQRTLIDTTHHTFHPQVRDMFHPQTGVFLEKTCANQASQLPTTMHIQVPAWIPRLTRLGSFVRSLQLGLLRTCKFMGPLTCKSILTIWMFPEL